MTARNDPADVLSGASARAWLSYCRDLRHTGSQPYTIDYKGRAIRELAEHLGRPELLSATRDEITAWLLALRDRGLAAGSVETYYRSARAFFNWCVREELLADSPMRTIRPPKLPEKMIPLPGDDELRAMLATCKTARDAGAWERFAAKRDEFVIRLLSEAGSPRASELCGIELADLDLRGDFLLIRKGKHSRERLIKVGHGTGKALDRYLIARESHKEKGRPELLLGQKGPMTRTGVRLMLKRRCQSAGIPVYSPHKLRHAASAAAKEAGMSGAVACQLFGWKSEQMYTRYGASAAPRVALHVAGQLGVGDRLG